MKFNHNRIKAERIAKGYTQQEMADFLGMKEAGYNRIENGNRKLNIETFTMICVALGIKPDNMSIFFGD